MDHIPTPSDDELKQAFEQLLEGAYWPRSLATNQFYTRVQDDCDGSSSIEHQLSVLIGGNGDVWLKLASGEALRFRTFYGGGQSLRVRNALLVLAEAIRRDNEERPQQFYSSETKSSS